MTVRQTKGAMTGEIVVDTTSGTIEEMRSTVGGVTTTTKHTYLRLGADVAVLGRTETVRRDAAGKQVGTSVVVTYSNLRLAAAKTGA